jgi:hypothetical protein
MFSISLIAHILRVPSEITEDPFPEKSKFFQTILAKLFNIFDSSPSMEIVILRRIGIISGL